MENNYQPTYGEVIEVECLYIICPILAGKKFQPVYLLLPSGERWIRSYRPISSEYQYADKRVFVRGRIYTSSPYVQSVGGTHFELQEIRLATGEIPYPIKPKYLPIPPKVDSQEQLRQRKHLWVHCTGTISNVQKDRYVYRAQLILRDGNLVAFSFDDRQLDHLHQNKSASDWTGVLVTLLGQVAGGVAELDIGRVRLCVGDVDSCGIADPAKISSKGAKNRSK